MLQAINAFMVVMLIPIMVLNFLGIVVAGIWLAIIGEWSSIGVGVVSFFVSGWVLGLALMPSMIFVAPAAVLIEKGKMVPGMVLAGLSHLYIVALFTAWCVFVFYAFMRRADSSSMWPYLIWSYGVATSPITWLASKERDNEHSTLTAFFVDIGCILMMILIAFFRVRIIDVAVAFGAVMLFALALNWYIVYAKTRLRY